MADDEWKKELQRFDERTKKRRAKAKEQEEKAQDLIRDSEQRRDSEKPPDERGGRGNPQPLLATTSRVPSRVYEGPEPKCLR
jgi:hypothetical protein